MDWISIKDKLPKYGVHVLAARSGWIQTVMLYTHAPLGKHGWDESKRKDGWVCICEDSYYPLDENYPLDVFIKTTKG